MKNVNKPKKKKWSGPCFRDLLSITASQGTVNIGTDAGTFES